MSSTIIRYEPRGAAAELMRYRGTEVCIVGSAGTGKTLAACWLMHLTALTVPGSVGLLVRATHTSLTSTTLVTFQRHVAFDAIRSGLVHWYGGSAKDPAAFRYSNGSTIYVSGADRPERFLSLEVDRVFIDEAVEITEDTYETLISRLRGPGDCRKQIILATNPSHPQHWIKRRADAGSIRMLTSKHEDNPWLFDRGQWTEEGSAYLAKLDKLTGVRYLRLRKGVWCAAEGVIYEDFDHSTHVVDSFTPPAESPLYVSVDFGFVHSFVAQFWRADEDERLVLQREIFYSRRLVEDHARQILEVLGEIGVKPTAIICDHQAESRAVLERHLGLLTTSADKAVNDGIQAVQSRMRVQEDGRPRLTFMRDALVERDPVLVDAGRPTCTVEEFPSYIWDTKKEQPVKENDDGCDATRYAVMYLENGFDFEIGVL